MKPLTTLDIDSKLRTLIPSTYIGTFSSDALAQVRIKRKPACLVVNTSPSHVSDGHWIGLYISRSNGCEVFCSFGLGRVVYGSLLGDFFTANAICTIQYNSIRLQPLSSSTCGYYVLVYLTYRTCGWSLVKIIRTHFACSPYQNDINVQRIIERMPLPL